MMLKPAFAAAVLTLAMSVASATTVADLGAATVTYDETTTLGGISGSFSSSTSYGFHWDLPSSATLVNVSPGTIDVLTVDLPSFTITKKAGYDLSNLSASFGNPSFFEFGGTTNIEFNADVSFDGGPITHVNGLIDWTLTSQGPNFSYNIGYFADSGTLPGPFSSFSVTNASLLLSAAVAEDGTFASITSNPQNRLEISFDVTPTAPVPEPETAAMLLAGLVAMGWVAQRRRNA